MNKAILMGRLTKDPELRYTTTNNTPVCTFTIAVDRKFVRQGEERQADFIPIVAWDKLGEFCSKYFTKGQRVAVSGRIQTRTWDDNEGKRHYITEIVAEDAYFADSKSDDSQPQRRQERPQPRKDFPEKNDDDFYKVDDGEDELPF